MVFVPGDAVLAIERRLRGVPRLKSAEDYFIDVHEVTVGMFRRSCEATSRSLPEQPRESTDRHPVVNVTWREAADYAAWVGKRLPTGFEWSAAALGDRRFPWGETEPSRTSLHFPSWPEEESWTPMPVGTHAEDQSSLGCFDMGANVREWVADEKRRTAAPVAKEPREWRCIEGWTIYRVVANGLEYASSVWVDSDRREPSIGFRCAISHPRERPPRTR